MSELTFKYDAIAETSSVIVKQRTSEIKSLMRSTAQGIVEIGHKLIEVKEELPHGQFGVWLAMEFDWSERTAQNFMNVASNFKSANFSDLQIAPSALYMLSSPSTPKSAREEAIDRAEQGESISHSTAKEITDSHKPSPDIPDNVDPETGEVTGEDWEYDEGILEGQVNRNSDAKPKRKGIGLQRAHEAIAILKQIPRNDGLLEEAYDTVIQWINDNR